MTALTAPPNLTTSPLLRVNETHVQQTHPTGLLFSR